MSTIGFDGVKVVFNDKTKLEKGGIPKALAEYDPKILDDNYVPEKPDFILIRQATNYTCGPASLSALTTLLPDQDYISEDTLAKIMDAKPKKGVPFDRITAWAEDHFGADKITSSTDNYKGGVGLINLRRQQSKLVPDEAGNLERRPGGGHWCVLLGRRDNTIRYFDPQEDHLVETKIDQIDWRNLKGDVEGFHITINGTEGEGNDLWDTKIAVVRNLAAGHEDAIEVDDRSNPAAAYIQNLNSPNI